MSGKDRAEFLNDVTQIVSKDRNTQHGEPEDTFADIADMWNAMGVTFKQSQIQSHHVALMMVAMKIARLGQNYETRDSWLDVAGYVRVVSVPNRMLPILTRLVLDGVTGTLASLVSRPTTTMTEVRVR